MLAHISSLSLPLLTIVAGLTLTGCAKAPPAQTGSGNGSIVAVAQAPAADIDNMTDAQADAWLAAQIDDGKISLAIGALNIRVEYADTPEKRQLGLMFRRELCDNCGMLFKFDSDRIGSIWMKNTFIPLDLAYINNAGIIVDIAQLQPHELTPVQSSSKVLYALEMNQGWFAEQDIRVGDEVSKLP